MQLVSNLYQQLYHKMNIQQQKAVSSNCFSTNNAFSGGIKLTTAALPSVLLGVWYEIHLDLGEVTQAGSSWVGSCG